MFQSDVYAYADVDGTYHVYVAECRYRCNPARQGPVDDATVRWWFNEHEHTDACYETVELPFKRRVFLVDTLDELLDLLACLRGHGLHVPDSAFSVIGEELAEESGCGCAQCACGRVSAK